MKGRGRVERHNGATGPAAAPAHHRAPELARLGAPRRRAFPSVWGSPTFGRSGSTWTGRPAHAGLRRRRVRKVQSSAHVAVRTRSRIPPTRCASCCSTTAVGSGCRARRLTSAPTPAMRRRPGLRATGRRQTHRTRPPAGITPQQLHPRDWWTGPEIYVVVDDYDLIGTGARRTCSPRWPSSSRTRVRSGCIWWWPAGSPASTRSPHRSRDVTDSGPGQHRTGPLRRSPGGRRLR